MFIFDSQAFDRCWYGTIPGDDGMDSTGYARYRTFTYDDPTLNIDWEIKGKPIVSEKDLELPFLQDLDIYN